jgi:hypothetical protein
VFLDIDLFIENTRVRPVIGIEQMLAFVGLDMIVLRVACLPPHIIAAILLDMACSAIAFFPFSGFISPPGP